MNLPPLPSFTEFFQALWQTPPFPWQAMLAERVAEKGWPDGIDLPTASGKTACLDIAVWALAQQSGCEKRSMPRRIWFVVDRRIVVDEAFERAQKIAAALEGSPSPIVRAVADCLFNLRGLPNRHDRPLAVGRLRGGVLRDDRWARIPSQAAIITSTVDQLGSRLLFRGYGHSALAAPIYAGLAGNDSLILLDEAHCAQPFLQTLRAVRNFRSAQWAEVETPAPFHVAVLSATPPGEDEGDTPAVFPADEEERSRALEHPVLQARLTATKRAVLKAVKDEGALEEAIARAAESFARNGSKRVGVIVNRVGRAMEIAAALQAKARENPNAGEPAPFDVELLTGRIRPVERDWLVEEKLRPVLHSLPERDPERPLILVSTQCLEVGADFSFDALVSECASLDALRQRFGRLARLGQPQTSQAVIFAAESALKESDPVYGDAVKATWEFLWSKAETSSRKDGRRTVEERSINFGFEALRALLPPPDSEEFRALLALSADAPILLPAHLDLLCQTAPPPHPNPDIGVFLHGKGRTAAEVRVALRCDLDPQRPQDWPEIASLCPPVAGEMFSVPLHRFRQWLTTQEAPDAAGDIEGEQGDESDDLAKRAVGTSFLIYAGREKSKVSRDPDAIYPDAVVLLPAPQDNESLGRVRRLGQVLCAQGFGAEKTDLWELALLRAGKTPALRLNRAVLAPWLTGCPPLRDLVELVENGEPLRAELDDAIATVLNWKPESETDAALPDWLRDLFAATKDYLVRDIASHPAGGIILRAKTQRSGADQPDYFADEDDARSEAPEAVELANHCTQVATTAEQFALACLGPDAAPLIKAAGYWHDSGKLDPRFQDLLRANVPASDGAVPLAKSPNKPRSHQQAQAAREAVGLPDDFRHEMLSAQLAEQFSRSGAASDDRELLLHLIASHHGHARPFAPVCEDFQPPAIEGQLPCGSIRLSAEARRGLIPLHRLDSGVAERFWALTRRYGWWGLAYREAILRLADWHASEHANS
jgi:CRISPR-associated endonuclease/helicase Cas3